MKGADSIIIDRLANKNIPKATADFLEVASMQGLRTLLMAVKYVTEE